MISYTIYKIKPTINVQHQQPYHHQHVGLFERRRMERKRDALPEPVFNLKVLPEEGNIASMPFTDELVTELRGNPDFTTSPPGLSPIAMGKIQYAKWLSALVYPLFQVNQLVTFKTIPITLNTVPKMFFVVRTIQEMHYWVQVDKETREPSAIGISPPAHVYPAYYPPSVLRGLVPSEIEAIDKLRNQEGEGRNRETSAVVIDRSTGEILSSD